MKRKLLIILLCLSLLLSLTTAVSAASTEGGGPDDFLADVSLPLLPARSSGLYDTPKKPLPTVSDKGFVADIEGWTPMFVQTGLPVTVSEADPSATVITDRAGLEAMTAGNYVLGADIDLSGTGWTPLNISGNLTLDGQSYTIKGLTIDMAGKASNGGLFGTVDGNLTVKNLRLERGNLTMNSTTTAYYGGMIAGKVEQQLTLENIAAVQLKILLSGSKVNSVGGLIGEANGESVLRNISAEVTIERDPLLAGNWMELGNNPYIGGVLGVSRGGILVENCYAKTELHVEDTLQIAGGLVGGQQGKNVRYANCKVETSIHAFNTCGGLFGKTASSEPLIQVENCVVLGDLKARQNLGGLVGNLSNRPLHITDSRFAGTIHHVAGGTVTSQELPAAGGLAGICAYTTLTAEGCAVDMTWSTDCADQTAPTFEGSVGGLAGYSRANLDLVVSRCSIQLIADEQTVDCVDLGGICGRNFGSSGSAAVRDTFAEVQADIRHKGGSTATGMIPRIGYASFVNCGAKVDIDMTATGETRTDASGMCWGVDSKATFAKCYASGAIRITADKGDGINTGKVLVAGLSDCGQTTQCYSGVDITVNCLEADAAGLILNTDGYAIVSSWSDASLWLKTKNASRVGGLVQFTAGNITDSCFTGSITTNNSDWLGGIASRATGTIRNCYADTDLANGKYIGGIVGSDYVPATTNIYNCRFTGSIQNAGQYAAGIMCYGNHGTVSGCEVDADIDCPDCLVGGIMAGNYGETIVRDCTVAGSVAGRLVGGIAGNCYSLSLYDCTVTATVDLAVSSDNTDARGAGGIAYAVLNIDNCHMKTPMNIRHYDRNICVGGICAAAPAGYRCDVTNCTSKGVTCFADSGSAIGGIAGGGAGNEQYLELYNCRVDGNVRLYVDGDKATVGGIVGRTGCSVYNCAVNGNVSVHADIPQGTQGRGSVFAGGIAGDMYSNGNEEDYVVSSCYHMGSVSATYSGEPAPYVHTDHPLVGEGGKIRNCNFAYDRENNEETYIIRTWWHEEYDTVMQPLGYAEVYLNDVFVGSTDGSGSLTLVGKDLSDNDRLIISAEKAGYRGTEKEAWFADGGVIDLYLMQKTPGKIYLKAARIYNSDDEATELLYTNNTVSVFKESKDSRKLYFEVDWNELPEENRCLYLKNEDGSSRIPVSTGENLLVLGDTFQVGDKILLEASDSAGEWETNEATLGLKLYDMNPSGTLNTDLAPVGDNEGKRGLDFLNGITMGASFGNVLGKWGGKVELENNILTIDFGPEDGTKLTSKSGLINGETKVSVGGKVQLDMSSEQPADIKWSGAIAGSAALDPLFEHDWDFQVGIVPCFIRSKVGLGGTFSGGFEGTLSDAAFFGTLGAKGNVGIGLKAGKKVKEDELEFHAGPDLGAEGTLDWKVVPENAGAGTLMASLKGSLSFKVTVAAGEFFKFEPGFQLGNFTWDNEKGAKFYFLGGEVEPAIELAGWMPADMGYLEEGGGFMGDSLQLLDWNGTPVADPAQPQALQLYENILMDAKSALALENGIPVLYFTADDGDGSNSGLAADNTVLWRTEYQNGIWSAPQMLTQPGSYVNGLDADGTGVIWVESDQTGDLSQLLTSTDIMVQFNGVTTQLTQGEGYVFSPKISVSADGQKALACWFANPAVTDMDSLLSGDGDVLYYADNNGSGWSKPRTMNVSRTIVEASPSQSQGDIFWLDEEGTLSAYHYSYTPYGGTLFSGVEQSAHQDTYTAAVTADGLTVWNNSSLVATIGTDPLEMVMLQNAGTQCVVWSETDGIYYADSATGWKVKPLVKTGQQPHQLSAVLTENGPQAAYFLTDYNSDQTDLIKHLYTASAPDLSGVDASVSQLDLYQGDLMRGGALRLTAQITNLGEDVLSGYDYLLTDETGAQIAAGTKTGLSLAYGDSDDCLVVFSPDLSAQHTYTLTVTAENDGDAANNASSVSTASDAQVVKAGFPVMPSGKVGMEVIVGNDGAAPVERMTVEIYRCTSDGTEIGQALTRKTFENVPGGSYRQLQLDQTESHQMYKVVVLSGDQQTDSHMLLWKDETARCLWVSDVDVRKNGDAKVTLYAQNQEQDLSLMLAVYQDEQMVACSMEADLDAWEGNKQVSMELDKLSAGDYTCVVYLLEQDTLIPVSEPYTFDLTF